MAIKTELALTHARGPLFLVSHGAAIAVLGVLFAASFFRLAGFPGLHGDEAWVGLRALDIAEDGFSSVHGMNRYTGALFPALVAGIFSLFGANVFTLRLTGALLNWAALALLTSAFWNRGRTAFYVPVLFGSSLLFLFSNRVAWEVCALQNLALAVIVFALSRILSLQRAHAGYVILFFAAFALGTWNHFIFLFATVSFAFLALLMLLRDQRLSSARVFILAALNLLLGVAIYTVAPQISDGNFLTHAMPTMAGLIVLVLAASYTFARADRAAPLAVMQFVSARSGRAHQLAFLLFCALVAALAATAAHHLTAFFGVLSGVIMLERVVSFVPPPGEMLAGFAWAAFLLMLFLHLGIREARGQAGRSDTLRSIVFLWPAAFLAVFQIMSGTSDRYYLIPNFLFLLALALMLDEVHSLRTILTGILVAGFAGAQFFFWSEAASTGNRRPIDFRFGPYHDTSRHFLKLDGLSAFLKDRGLCRTEGANFFIEQPLRFLEKTQPVPCHTGTTARIEYCDTCEAPVQWFRITYKEVLGP